MDSARVHTSTTLRIVHVTLQTCVILCKKINQVTHLVKITQIQRSFNQDKHMKFVAVGKFVFLFSPFLRQKQAHFILRDKSMHWRGTWTFFARGGRGRGPWTMALSASQTFAYRGLTGRVIILILALIVFELRWCFEQVTEYTRRPKVTLVFTPGSQNGNCGNHVQRGTAGRYLHLQCKENENLQ